MPFSGYAEVVESKAWVQEGTGATASIYGCKPHGEGWSIQPKGWDIAWSGDGTVGRCKPPFATREEAETYAGEWNGRRIADYVRCNREPPELPEGVPVIPYNIDEE